MNRFPCCILTKDSVCRGALCVAAQPLVLDHEPVCCQPILFSGCAIGAEFVFKKLLFFSHNFLLGCSLPSLHPTQNPYPCFSSEKKKSRPLRDIHQTWLTRSSKTGYKPSYQGWRRQPRRKNRVLSVGKRLRHTPCTKLRYHKAHVEDLAQTHTEPVFTASISVSPYSLA